MQPPAPVPLITYTKYLRRASSRSPRANSSRPLAIAVPLHPLSVIKPSPRLDSLGFGPRPLRGPGVCRDGGGAVADRPRSVPATVDSVASRAARRRQSERYNKHQQHNFSSSLTVTVDVFGVIKKFRVHWLITFEVLFEFTLVLDIGQVLKSDCACYAAITSLAAFCGRCSQVNIYFKFSYENQSGRFSGHIPIRKPSWPEKLNNNMTKTWSPKVSIRVKPASGSRIRFFIWHPSLCIKMGYLRQNLC